MSEFLKMTFLDNATLLFTGLGITALTASVSWIVSWIMLIRKIKREKQFLEQLKEKQSELLQTPHAEEIKGLMNRLESDIARDHHH